MKKIAIVKYNAGNVQSVRHALQRLGYDALWTDDPAILLEADKVIFPGVGEASSAMSYLKARGLDQTLKEMRQPILGICLGLQLFCQDSEEGDTNCLGIFNTRVKRFPAIDLKGEKLKSPHMGWNTIHCADHPLFDNLQAEKHCYFVHSYYADPCTQDIATCVYGAPFSAALQRNNFYAVQFHPEKSGAIGQQILKNFLELC